MLGQHVERELTAENLGRRRFETQQMHRLLAELFQAGFSEVGGRPQDE
jgi:hypothetical protein